MASNVRIQPGLRYYLYLPLINREAPQHIFTLHMAQTPQTDKHISIFYLSSWLKLLISVNYEEIGKEIIRKFYNILGEKRS